MITKVIILAIIRSVLQHNGIKQLNLHEAL